ncbi:MAG: Na+/H+ antiporter NhaA [Actinomycetota bacterium]|nr:Na+/H+ antiporter NhaA [Actinomycetota bacterium]
MADAAGPAASARERAVNGAAGFVEFLRQETTGGKLLLAATAIALLWANVAEDSYVSFWTTETKLGPGWLHLDLKLADWAADGLLAIFFFVAGLELKRELTVGELSDRRAAALPVLAAVGGMVVPALVALAVSGGAATEGGAWAIPVATDIAFALGVLAIAGAVLPSGVRVLLLSIAVIDDLLAITLIALLFTHDLALGWVAAAAALSCLYWLAFRVRADRAAVLLALAIAVWICIHASGVHATVAGIVLALLTPVRPRAGQERSRGEHLEHRLHPVSAGVAVPVFALAAAGISVAAVGDAVSDSIAIGVFAGLLVGKVVGIYGGARLAVCLRLGTLPERVGFGDVVPLAMLGAIGYTVSLLIARLALGDPAAAERSAASVLLASVLASLAAVVLLRRRSRAG